MGMVNDKWKQKVKLTSKYKNIFASTVTPPAATGFKVILVNVNETSKSTIRCHLNSATVLYKWGKLVVIEEL